MLVRLFDIQNSKVIPSEHCYALPFLNAIMENYPDTHLKIYQYISSVEKHINPTVKSYMDDYFIRLKKKFSINKEIF